MKNRILVLSLAGALVASVLTVTVLAQTTTGSTPPTTPAPAAKKGTHPAIRAAITALQGAKTHMQNANHDFGGHRAAALAECDKALAQLQLALEFDK